jgi:hypothetical protein
MSTIIVLPSASTKMLTRARFESSVSLSPYLTEKTVDANWFLQLQRAPHADHVKPVITVTGL